MKLKLSLTVLLASLTTLGACTFGTPTTNPSSIPSGISGLPVPKSSSLKPPVFDNAKLDGLKINLKGDQSNIAGVIVDSKTNQIINKKITVSIEGADKEKVENLNFSFDTGDIKFKLKKGINPSVTSPVNITVVAHSDGYFSSSVPLEIKNAKTSTFNLNLVDMKNTPKGVVSQEKTDSKADSSGVLSNKIDVTLSEPTSNTKVTLIIPENTGLKDKSGNPLTGNIKTNIGFFNNRTPESISSFPGGLNDAQVNNNGKQQDGYFMTGGFTSIELTDDSGNKAATFSKPVEISMQIPKGTINPETGKEIKQGDKIGIWSYDTNTGKWASEGEGIAGNADSTGNFTVKYNVTHLSYWNLDWFYSPKCDPKLRLIFNGSPIPVQIEAQFQGQYYPHPSVLKDELNDLYNVPTDREVTFTAKFGDKEVGKKSITLGESCPEIGMNINTEGLPQMREIPVYIGVKSKTEFTFDEIRTLATNLNVTTAQQNIIFEYFTANNITDPVKLTPQIISDLKAKGVEHLDELKALLDQKVSPDAWLYDFVSNPYSFDSREVVGGKASIRVFDGETHTLSVSFYYKDKYYWFNQDVTISQDTKEVILEKEDTDLTIDIVKDYLKKMGISINSLKK